MSTDEQAIREAISEASQKLADLRRDLESVDGELEALSDQRHRYELLNRVCGSLEELEQLGGEKLFWGQSFDLERTAEHVRQVRQRVRKFESHVAAIEQRRRSIAERIEVQDESVGFLGEDLADALEEEESRRAEWIIEREEADLPYRAQVMPWMRGLEEDGQFRRLLAACTLVATLMAFVLPLVDLPMLERSELIEVPERVARLIRETPVPPPRPVVEEPVPEEDQPEPEAEPDPLLAEETPPEPEPDPVAEPAPEPAKQAAEQQVQSKGILAFRESFASRAESRPSAQLGSQARLGNAGDAAVGRPERSMVTTTAPGSSGGINLGDISRDVGGGGGGQQIAGVRVTQVASSIAAGGGAERPLSGGQSAGRTDEEIQIVFDRYKASLYRLYNRELRNDPTLRGQLVIRLTIEPDGRVSLCQLEASDMKAPTLAEQVVERIRDFDFGAKEGIVAMTIIYPIDFLPAA
jgi:outer membrane biosynthesis protein TonB